MIFFIGVIFALENTFHERLKVASLSKVNVHAFKEYSDDDKNVVYKLPDNWENKEREYDLGNTIYHSEFYDKINSIGGHIQLSNKRGDLESAVAPKAKQGDKQEYNYRPIKVNGYNGYVVEENIESANKLNRIKFVKYYIDGEELRVVMTFYISNKDYNEEFDKVFNAVVETIKVD